MKDVDIGIVTRVGATTGEDILHPQVQLMGKKNKAFDIATEKETFF